MSDYVIRATAADGEIRAFASTTRDLVEEARKAHNTSPVATAALGRLLTAGVMMGIDMKGEKDLLTLKIQGDGPIGGLTVTADSLGNVKGYAFNPMVMLPPNSKGKLDVGGALGVDSFLQLNMEGKRFMNEDVPGQNIADEHTRQPVAKDPELAKAGVKSWQIFDSKWPEQIIHMPDGHGYTTYFVPDDKIAEYETVLSGFGLGYTTQAMVDEAADVKCDTLEELAEIVGYTGEAKTNFLAEVERYNELCAKGHDDDWGCDPQNLLPIKDAPFFASFGTTGGNPSGGLCQHAAICTDGRYQVLTGEKQPIAGLYAAGNTCGQRYGIQYATPTAGNSCGSALTSGYCAAESVIEDLKA